MSLDVESAIAERMYKDGGVWHCSDCQFQSPRKDHVTKHVEAKHIVHGGYSCPDCGTVLKTKACYSNHQKRFHSQR